MFSLTLFSKVLHIQFTLNEYCTVVLRRVLCRGGGQSQKGRQKGDKRRRFVWLDGRGAATPMTRALGATCNSVGVCRPQIQLSERAVKEGEMANRQVSVKCGAKEHRSEFWICRQRPAWNCGSEERRAEADARCAPYQEPKGDGFIRLDRRKPLVE